MNARLGILLLAALLSQPATAATTAEVRRTCPLTGTEFTATVAASGYRSCQRLDMKPVGAIFAPYPVPICPDDGFPVYKESFSESETAQLRGWVESEEFRAMAAAESSYFRIAKIQEKLGASAYSLAWSYLQASWQVEHEPEKYGRYAALTLEMVDRHLAELGLEPATEDAWDADSSALLATELARKLGRFDEARTRLKGIEMKAVADEHVAALLRYEASLIDESDSGAHYYPLDEQEKCASHDPPLFGEKASDVIMIEKQEAPYPPVFDYRDGVVAGDAVYVGRDGVALRAEPATSSPKVGVRNRGDSGTLIEKRAQWCRLGEGEESGGWVACVFLSRKVPG